jgi:hypothetical protein
MVLGQNGRPKTIQLVTKREFIVSHLDTGGRSPDGQSLHDILLILLYQGKDYKNRYLSNSFLTAIPIFSSRNGFLI